MDDLWGELASAILSGLAGAAGAGIVSWLTFLRNRPRLTSPERFLLRALYEDPTGQVGLDFNEARDPVVDVRTPSGWVRPDPVRIAAAAARLRGAGFVIGRPTDLPNFAFYGLAPRGHAIAVRLKPRGEEREDFHYDVRP